VSKRLHTIGLLAILVLGGGLRLAGLFWGQGWGSNFTDRDEVLAYRMAVDYGLGDEQARYLGQPKFNKASQLPGPLWTLFGFVSIRLWGFPQAIGFSMVLLNTFFVYLVYLLAKRVLGIEYSLWAALFAATQPWAVFYSVGAYNPETMPALGALLFLALWAVTQRPRSPAVFWVCFLLLISLQIHLSGLLLLPAVLVLLMLSPQPVSKRWSLAGMAAGSAMYIPYLLGEMAHGWVNTLGMAQGRSYFSLGILKVLDMPISLMIGWGGGLWGGRYTSDYLAMGDTWFGSRWIMIAFLILETALVILFTIAFVKELRDALRGNWRSPRAAFRQAPALVFITVLLVIPILCFMLTGHSYATRYGLIQFSVLLLLPPLFIVRRLPAVKRAGLLRGCIVLMVLFHCFLMVSFSLYRNRQIREEDRFIPTFSNLEAVYQALRAHAGPNGRIQVEVGRFLKETPERAPEYGAWILKPYVEAREREIHGLSPRDVPTRFYELRTLDGLPGDRSLVAYQRHRIVLTLPAAGVAPLPEPRRGHPSDKPQTTHSGERRKRLIITRRGSSPRMVVYPMRRQSSRC